MPEERKRYKPWIWRRLLIVLLLSALLPLGVAGLLTVAMPSSGVSSADPCQQVADESQSQLVRTATAHADKIDSKLKTVSASVSLLAQYASVVLSAPDIFTAQVVPDLAAQAEEAAQAKTGDIPSEKSVPSPLDNPLFYSDSDDGAVRKLIDDGRPAVYFAKPASGKFTTFDLQRLHALAALDPLLMEPTRNPLCSQMFVITRDNLLRTYPFHDFSLWSADKDLGKPRNYWSDEKADENGVLWTSPYFSAFTDTWVIACISAIRVGDRIVAVAGCEIDLKVLSEEILTFSLSQGGSCWLIKPIPLEGDKPARWLLLAAQSGARDMLGAVPLSAAELPTEKHTGVHILEESDILGHARAETLQLLKGQLNINAESPGQVLSTTEITYTDGSYLASAPIAGPGWILGGVSEYNSIQAVRSFVGEIENSTRHRLVVLFAAVFTAVILAFAFAWFEARRIAQPLQILGQQVKQATLTKRTSSVSIADDGEIGALATAVQDLIDATTKPRNGNVSSDGNGNIDFDPVNHEDVQPDDKS